MKKLLTVLSFPQPAMFLSLSLILKTQRFIFIDFCAWCIYDFRFECEEKNLLDPAKFKPSYRPQYKNIFTCSLFLTRNVLRFDTVTFTSNSSSRHLQVMFLDIISARFLHVARICMSKFPFFFAKVQIGLKLIIKNRSHKLNYCGVKIIVIKCAIFLFCQRRSNVQQIYNEWSCLLRALPIRWFLTVWRKAFALEGIKLIASAKHVHVLLWDHSVS